ncbi:MAG TPA: SAV_915 family protein [Actinocrinis sp.]|nr:SAV_915 family protein [Actinocrinis sp.]
MDDTSRISAQLPTSVYIPAHPRRDPDHPDPVLGFEIRVLADGTRVLPAFSTVEQLAAALGPAQPWALLPLRAARALLGIAGVDSVLIDPQVADGAPRWTAQDLAQLVGSVR